MWTWLTCCVRLVVADTGYPLPDRDFVTLRAGARLLATGSWRFLIEARVLDAGPQMAQRRLPRQAHDGVPRAIGCGPVGEQTGQVPDVEIGPGLRLSVAHLVVGLQQERRGQQAGRHAGATIVQTIQLGEVGIAEQLATQ